MKTEISKSFLDHEEQILHYIHNFRYEGKIFGKAKRNVIKVFPLNGTDINIKSFQIPNSVNKFAYRFFRKSKAERSYKYAQILLSKGIGTPFPIAFSEERNGFTMLKSFYVSSHLHPDLTFRELVQNPDFPNHEAILRAFTRFTFGLHEKNIEFLDHSPGNTLIHLNEGDYKFYLVDLNRMNFRKLDFDARMKNFSRLTPKREMVEIMANEYAKFIEEDNDEVFRRMWFYINKFQERHLKKKRFKEKYNL